MVFLVRLLSLRLNDITVFPVQSLPQRLLGNTLKVGQDGVSFGLVVYEAELLEICVLSGNIIATVILEVNITCLSGIQNFLPLLDLNNVQRCLVGHKVTLSFIGFEDCGFWSYATFSGHLNLHNLAHRLNFFQV